MKDKGFDINHTRGLQGNALQAASYTGYENTVRHLLELGADVKFRYPRQHDAPQAATYAGREGVVRILLDAGADPKSQVACLIQHYRQLLIKVTPKSWIYFFIKVLISTLSEEDLIAP